MDEQIDNGFAAALEAGLLKPNDIVAITAGLPLQTAGTTNMLRVSIITDKRSSDSDERNEKIGYRIEEAQDKEQPAVFPERRWDPYGPETVT